MLISIFLAMYLSAIVTAFPVKTGPDMGVHHVHEAVNSLLNEIN